MGALWALVDKKNIKKEFYIMTNKTEFKLKTKHLFSVITFVKKTKLVSTFKDFQSISKIEDGEEKNSKGFDVIETLLTLLETHEQETYELLSELKEVSVEEIKEQELSETISMFTSIFNNETVKSFF